MVNRVKGAVEYMFTDKCTVYEKKPVTTNGLTEFVMRIKYENIACRLSAKSYLFGESTANDDGQYARIAKKAKLLVPSKYTILPGSSVLVKRLGDETMYAKCAKQTKYPSHNEVMLEISQDRA